MTAAGTKSRRSTSGGARSSAHTSRLKRPSARTSGQAPNPTNQDSERRKEIIERAVPILMKEGYRGISMNELARRLHLTKPGLYYHFKDKQELVYASMHRAMDYIEKMSLEATMSTSDNRERLREIIYQHALRVALNQTRGAVTTLIVDDVAFLKLEDRRVITQRKRTYFDLVRATVTQLQKEGRLRKGLDPTVATFTVLGMAMWLSKWYRPDGRLGAKEVAGQVADMALAAVCP